MKYIHTELKHRMRDLFIWFVAVFGATRLYRRFMRKHGPLVRIIVFHDVPNRRWFDLIIEEIQNSFHIITPDEFHRGEFHQKQINVLFTFDDGYASWVSAVLPALAENGIKGIFFVSSSLLDVAHDSNESGRFMRERLLITPREPLTWEGLKKLHDAGHTIGGHTLTHANLVAVSPDVLMSEILDDKHAIERHLGVTITDFAYPFGTHAHINEHIKERVRSVGYLHGYSAESGFVRTHETFMIPRMCIEETLYSRPMRRWIKGGYDIFLIVKRICAR